MKRMIVLAQLYCRYVVGIRHRFSQPLCGAVGEKRVTTVILN